MKLVGGYLSMEYGTITLGNINQAAFIADINKGYR